MALHFFFVAVVLVAIACLVSSLLMRIIGRDPSTQEFHFPAAFLLSTFLLGFGSFAIHRAVEFVKVERQREFRFWLIMSAIVGSLFMGVQTFALWSMFPEQRTATAASTGVTAFVTALATLHGLHFSIAVLFVSFVIAKTWAERYDHEYHWGVKVCAWFWHGLGMAWIAILAICAIALV